VIIRENNTAYRERRIEDFNQSVSDYRNWLAEKVSLPVEEGRGETSSIIWSPSTSRCHLRGGLAARCAFWLNLSEPVRARRSASVWLLCPHVTRFPDVSRTPAPVTNLYSSAIFVGWERDSRIILERFFAAEWASCRATVGFVTQIIVTISL